MRKVSKIIIMLCLTILGIVSLFFLNKKEEKVLRTKIENKSNFISIMVEQEDGAYKESTNVNFVGDGYLFNPSKSECENGGTISWNKEKEKVETSLLTSDKCYVYFDIYNIEKYCKYSNEESLVCDILRNRDNTIIYHDGKADYNDMENVNLEADDLSYRYTGANEKVNNYICFGSGEEKCPADNLYRIIGFFKNDAGDYETKVIKADYANKNLLGSGATIPNGTVDYNKNGAFYGAVFSSASGNDQEKDGFTHRYRGSLTEVNRYKYQENGTNETKANWPTSLLNTIHLNHNFLNTFSNNWREKIVDYKWHYKGSSVENIIIESKNSNNTVRTTYDYEIGSKADKILTEPTKIGLMYVSDYLYSASSNNWNKKPYNGVYTYVLGEPDSNGFPQGTYGGNDGTDYRSAIDENWMYLGLWEWTITQQIDDSGTFAFSLRAPGNGSYHSVGTQTNVVRPCFYLTSDTQIKSGNGSLANPYRIM